MPYSSTSPTSTLWKETDVIDLRGQRLRAVERTHELFPGPIPRGSDYTYCHIPHEQE